MYFVLLGNKNIISIQHLTCHTAYRAVPLTAILPLVQASNPIVITSRQPCPGLYLLKYMGLLCCFPLFFVF